MLRGLLGGKPEEEQEQVDVLAEAQTRVQRDPQDASAHFDLGSTYYVRGDVEKAVESLERAVELDESNDDANYMLGLAYERLGRQEDAIRQFQVVRETTDNAMLQNYAQQKMKSMGVEVEE
jgi:cytochrome c-type biogenesis protein CcmH/NrfG